MRVFSDSIAGLLKSDCDDEEGDLRCTERLCLEFFPTEESDCVDRLIPTAIGQHMGIESRISRLEVVSRPPLVSLTTTMTVPHTPSPTTARDQRAGLARTSRTPLWTAARS
jgi:hypothetical protein